METAIAKTKSSWWNGGRSPFNVSYGKLMMWYFLMSDSFTFGAFLISYGSIRFSLNNWVDHNYVFNEFPFTEARSEERRVGKECRSGWVTRQEKEGEQ